MTIWDQTAFQSIDSSLMKFICDFHSEFHFFMFMVHLFVLKKGAVLSSITEIAQVFRPPYSGRSRYLALIYFMEAPVLAGFTYQPVAHVITVARYFYFGWDIWA